MNKFFLIFFFFLSNLYSQSEQIVFVLSQKYSSQKAKLIRYEKIDDNFLQISKTIEVNIGEKGLAWGLSPLIDFQVKNMILKKRVTKKQLQVFLNYLKFILIIKISIQKCLILIQQKITYVLMI